MVSWTLWLYFIDTVDIYMPVNKHFYETLMLAFILKAEDFYFETDLLLTVLKFVTFVPAGWATGARRQKENRGGQDWEGTSQPERERHWGLSQRALGNG